ncbi:hypothetical protein K488DRAFT_74506 [Vararia minispora EC-137]|uniref:Uncharacterized protein n=1 Tax=Vararia minispora EC-137 TaxID=1314806 RepID=A0ACB8Q715_9AGAM|nr:hypothetical protein K488DRAFT_74506 [Vararia minispora EC-137]
MFIRSYVFFGLNIVRTLSCIGCILVFASSIVTLVHDVRAVNAHIDAGKAGGSNSTSVSNPNFTNYEYIADSTVPNQAAGAVFSVSNRLLIIFQVIMIFLSEVGWPQVFFDRYFPILGRDFGLGALGVMQLLQVSLHLYTLGCQILSHFVDTFSLVSAFFLASIGCVNMFLGLVFRHHARSRRSIRAWRERAKEVLPAPVAIAADKLSSAVFTNDRTWEKDKDAESTQEKFSGFGFGRQGEKAAGKGGLFISRPLESLPRYASSAAPSMHS